MATKSKRKTVQIVEMGLRDGLQNEKIILTVPQRLQFLDLLVDAGLKRIEIGSFVSPKWIPQMEGSFELVQKAYESPSVLAARPKLSALVPNERGMTDALLTPISEVAIFASCSETFSQKNINCSIAESFERFKPVLKIAKSKKIKVRGYLSVCFGCPFEGNIDEKTVVELAVRMYKMGAYEISIGDTIGVASPAQVESLFKKLRKKIPAAKLAGHFHDTRGTALANILKAYELGVQVFDTSAGGLGGCPYAKGATGNVATEDVVYMFEKMNIKTGVDLEKLVAAQEWIASTVGHTLSSRAGRVGFLKI